MTVYIGLTGEAGAGKDVTGQLLKEIIEKDGNSCTIYSFAKPVYDLAMALVNADLRPRQGKEISRVFKITKDNLENMHDVFIKYGLHKFDDFPDVWDKFESTVLEKYKCYSWETDALYGINISPRHILEIIGTEFGRVLLSESVWLSTLEYLIKRDNSDVAIVTDVRFDNEGLFISERGRIFNIECPNNEHATKSAHVSAKGINKKFISCNILNEKQGLEVYSKVLLTVYTLFLKRKSNERT